MAKAKEIYMYVLGAIVVLGILAIIGLLVYVPMPAENKDALMLVLGVLAAKFSDVIAYFFGSSKGSADKTQIMADNVSK
jgi:hypothetical protein